MTAASDATAAAVKVLSAKRQIPSTLVHSRA